jgi:hypothetical protein
VVDDIQTILKSANNLYNRRNPWVISLWVICLLFSFGILIASIPGYLDLLTILDQGDEFYSLAYAATWLGNVISFGIVFLSMMLAGLLIWRRPNEPIAVLTAFFLLSYGVVLGGPFEFFIAYWYPLLPYLALQVQTVMFIAPFIVLLLTFPNGHFLPRWTISLVPLTIALLISFALFLNAEESIKLNTTQAQAINGVLYGLLAICLYIQVYRYRNFYTPVERQQTKLVLFGIILMFLLLIPSGIIWIQKFNASGDSATPPWEPFLAMSWWLILMVLPISFTLAILRSHLWDIDLLIRRTLVYTILTGVLVLVYFSGVALLQNLLTKITGHQSAVAIVISTLAIAALFNPLRKRVQEFIDQRFYRSKYNAEQALAEFAVAARDEVDTELLTSRLLGVVDKTIQPVHVSIWLKEYDSETQNR